MIRVYDKNLQLLALLQNVYDVGYEKEFNSITSAEFSLPGNDPKNQYCEPFNFVEIFEDGNERIDLFRIMPNQLNKNSTGVYIKYSCEHVLGTLFDDVLFKYHQTTNLNPSQTIQYLLSKQTIQHWQLGKVDFTEAFSYKWENELLINAILSITKPYNEEFQWTWDTTTYPWTLNLIRPSNEIKSYIRYAKNLIGIEKDTDPEGLITRYYCLGYGEGDNQLTIESVNNGLPYIDADTQEQYGIISYFYVDKTEENPTTLKAKATAALEKSKLPCIKYKVSAADVHSITGNEIDKFDTGDLVQVYDNETGIDFCARIVRLTKPNITENPGDVKLEIANKEDRLITTQLASVERKQLVSDVYSQGATNIDSNDYQDNCDATHPAMIKFYIPNECVRINKCLLSYEVEKFRTYEKSLESAPASSQTSSSGGGASTTSGGDTYYTEKDHTSLLPVTDWANEGTEYEHRHIIDGVNHSHTVNIQEHNHNVNIPAHNHIINYGIYEYSDLPESVVIKVDGKTVEGVTELNRNDINIVPYLSKDGEGKITRGTFHKVEIFPCTSEQNLSGLARITASVVKQIFLQSRGEGNY